MPTYSYPYYMQLQPCLHFAIDTAAGYLLYKQVERLEQKEKVNAPAPYIGSPINTPRLLAYLHSSSKHAMGFTPRALVNAFTCKHLHHLTL